MGSKKSKKSNLYFILSFLIVFLFSFLIFVFYKIQIEDIKIKELKQNEERIINFQNELLDENFSLIFGDINYLNYTCSDNLYTKKDLDEIGENWIEFSNQRGIYDQIRFLDKSGDEIIRVNYENNKAYLVEKSRLQNKKDRYYFKETELLKTNDIYVSPLDLNIENEKIEIPYKPMIRFSTPVYDEYNDFQGVIILNYLADSILKIFKELSQNSQGDISLLNSNSFWLSSKDKNNEWGFMFDSMNKKRFQSYYPEEWEIVKQGKNQIITENGLFTFNKVNLNSNFIGENKNTIYLDDEWYIVSLISPENDLSPYFFDNTLLIVRDIFKKNILSLTLITLFATITSYFVYLNKKQHYKTKYYSEYDPLTKTLNRRAGYKKINKLISKSQRKKVLFSLCFIDINGLKEINDNLGHEFGDELLITVSDAIRLTIRKNDFIIRQGGDEFLIVFDNIATKESEEIWTRIVSKFEEVNKYNDRAYLVSVSHGIVEYSSIEKVELDELVKEADKKMYQEKTIIKKNFNVLR